jgi:hypothetical protein
VTTRTLGMPAELRRHLEYVLPWMRDTCRPTVRITPRDSDERRCAVYAADHYEISAFYTTTDAASITALEDALKATPGVYLTTRAQSAGGACRQNVFTNPTWPTPLGTARRDRDGLRMQVLALIRDEEAGR